MTFLDLDLLVIDQVTGFLSNDFAIYDEDGRPVGQIRTEGSMLGRMFAGSRTLSVWDISGAPLLRLDDVMSFGRDTFVLTDGQGQRLADLRQEFTFFSKRLSLQLASGPFLEVTGNLFERSFQVNGPGGLAAQVARTWPGLAGGLLGHNRYVLHLAPGLPLAERASIVGTVIALDLIREKEQGGSSGISIS